MKKGILLILFVLPLVLWAAPAKNKVSTVTYFPVPYVAYNRLDAKQQMDIGLDSNMCRLDLGCDALGNRPLATSNTVVQKGTLAINTKTNGVINNRGEVVLGQGTSSFSSGDERGFAELEFGAVRIRHVENPQGSLNVKDLKVENLNLFGKPFPSCKDEGVAGGQMTWQDLPLNYDDPSEVKPYLVCGASCPEDRRPPNGPVACLRDDLKIAVGGRNADQLAAMTTPDGTSYSEFFTSNGDGSWTVNDNVQACGIKTVTYSCNPSNASNAQGGWYAVSDDVSGCIPYKTTGEGNCTDLIGGTVKSCAGGTYTASYTCQNTDDGPVIQKTIDRSSCQFYAWRPTGENSAWTSCYPYTGTITYHDSASDTWLSTWCTQSRAGNTHFYQYYKYDCPNTTSGQRQRKQRYKVYGCQNVGETHATVLNNGVRTCVHRYDNGALPTN